jgi:hypothetical protein
MCARIQVRLLASVLLMLALLWPALVFAAFKFDDLNFPTASPGGPLGPGHLDNHMPLSRGGRSLGFLTSVGGVAFGAVAQPDPGLEITGLTYDPQAPDGERLLVSIQPNDGTAAVVLSPIPDWLLVPVAKFAAGTQDAAMTMFGKAASEDETARQLAAGNDILNYHPAFLDTLAGLRLMHADILVLYQGASELPTLDGNVLLGTSEQEGDVVANAQAINDLQQFLTGLSGNPFQSYVVGDFEQNVRVSSTGSTLAFEGDPYWHCWKLTTSDPAQIDEAQQLANLWANRILQRESDHDSMYLSNTEWNNLYTQEYQNALFDDIFDTRISRALLLLMPEYSAAMSKRIADLGGLNPVVYSALRMIMHHAALFRLMSHTKPGVLDDFVASLANVVVAPPVQVPLLFHPPS